MRMLAFAAACLVTGALAQVDALPRIGLLANTVPMSELAAGTTTHPGPVGMIQGLRDLGWVEGKNVRLVWRSAEGDLARLPALAEELVRLRPDVLVGWGAGVQALANATDRVPIVMGASTVIGKSHSLRIDSLARPGHNVTGLSLVASGAINSKRLELLKQAVPSASRVAILADTPYPADRLKVSQSMGVTLQSFGFGGRVEQLEPAFDAMVRAGVHAVIVDEMPATNLAATQSAIHRLAERHRLPVMHMVLSATDSGGLLAYGHDINKLYRRAPYFIDRILRGTKPGDIPIEQPTEFELRVNLKAANAIGLSVPQSLLLQANRVIE